MTIIALQVVWCRRFFSTDDSKQNDLGDDFRPKTLVLLPLRGADPFLDRCLRGLLSQTYDNYHLRIILDTATDPAHEVVNSILAQHPAELADVRILKEPLPTCSLKVSALLQEYARMPDDIEVLVTVDADTTPHPTWLEEHLAPMRDQEVAMTNGYRWYVPKHRNVASLMRQVWNLFAVLQAYTFKIPWGGSLAIRVSTLRETRHEAIWRKSLTDDVPLQQAITSSRQKFVIVPSLAMVNEESVSWTGCYRFLVRQMAMVRWHSNCWSAVVAFGLIMPSMALLLYIPIIVALFHGLWQVVLIGLLLVATMHLSMLYIFALFESKVRAHLGERARQLHKPMTLLDLELACHCMLPLYPLMMFSAARMRHMTWRGILYLIRGRYDFELVEYTPFVAAQPKKQLEHASI